MGILFHPFFRDLKNRFSAKRNLRTCQKRQIRGFTKILTIELIDFHTWTMFFTNSMKWAGKMISGRLNWQSYLVLPVWQNCPYWLLFSEGVENSRLLSWLLTENVSRPAALYTHCSLKIRSCTQEKLTTGGRKEVSRVTS